MDENTFMELDLAVWYLQLVNQHHDSLLKINILQQDDNGLARMTVNADDIPGLPLRPKPRIFDCPGVKQVTWCPTPTPHYFIVGYPSAVVLVTKQRILKKAYRAIGYIISQMETRGSLLNWGTSGHLCQHAAVSPLVRYSLKQSLFQCSMPMSIREVVASPCVPKTQAVIDKRCALIPAPLPVPIHHHHPPLRLTCLYQQYSQSRMTVVTMTCRY
jgi:hypothetical protein